MITLEKVLTELKPESMNEIVGGGSRGFFDYVGEIVDKITDEIVEIWDRIDCGFEGKLDQDEFTIGYSCSYKRK